MSSPRKSPPHMLTGTSLSHWRHLRRKYGPIDPPFRRRARKIAWGAALLSGARWYESLRYGSAARAVRLDPSPVFIIGHWQAGHSLMHELFCQDEQFGHVTLLHSVLPRAFLSLESLTRRFLKRRLNKTRHVDSMALSLDAPQGDDFALAGLSDISIYHAYIFPRHAEEIFRRSVLLEGLTPEEIAAWQQTYYAFLQKVALHTGRNRLVLRNATNTGRIPRVLEIFPQAKFVHLRRNPYAVYAAQSRRWSELLKLWSLQDGPIPGEELVLSLYEQMLARFFRDSASLPQNQLVDVAYEDLRQAPFETMRHVYLQLELPGFEQASRAISRYLAADVGALAGDDVRLDQRTCEVVERRWGFAIKRWGYARPEVGEVSVSP